MMVKKNRFVKPHTRYYLGLDLGVTSVGWAVMSETNISKKNINSNHYLHDFGVHLFELPGDNNKGVSFANKRRLFRGKRRLIQRKKQRIKDIKNFLFQCGLKKENIVWFKQTNKIYWKKDKYWVVKENDNTFENIYVLKHKGLNEKITPEEFYKIVLHYCNNRGYVNKFNEETDDKKKQEEWDKRLKLGKKLALNTYPTEKILKNVKNKISSSIDENGQYFLLYARDKKLNLEDPKKSKKTESPLIWREDYQKEFLSILNTQIKLQKNNKFWQNVLNKKPKWENNKDIFQYWIEERIFNQRDFETGPNRCQECEKKQSHSTCSRYGNFLSMTGNCPYFPDESRGYKSNLLFIFWNACVEISKILQYFKWLKLSKDSYSEILKIAILNQNVKKTIKEFLINKLTSDQTNRKWEIKSKFKKINAQNQKQSKDGINLNKAHYLIEIKKINCLSQYLQNLNFKQNLVSQLANDNFINGIGKILRENITPNRRKREINFYLNKEKISLDEKELKTLLKTSTKATTTCKVSFKLMEKQLNWFLDGNSDLEKCQKLNFQFRKSKKLFGPIFDRDLEKNPVVFRAVNETRKILKALHNDYGKFHNITIEIARDASDSWKERSKKNKGIKARENKKLAEANIKIQNELKNNGISPTLWNQKKYKLWKQQNEQCIYSGEPIHISELNSSELQIDHIIPRSIWTDNTIDNLVLVKKSANEEKGNRFPLAYLKGELKISFLKRVDELENKKLSKNDPYFYKCSSKKIKSLKIENDKDLKKLTTDKLVDTQDISKWFRNYVSQQLQNHNLHQTTVNVVPGQITSFLRQNWLSGPWGGNKDEIRDITPFNHAVDAMILVQLKSLWYIEMATDLNTLRREWVWINEEKNPKLKINKQKNYNNLKMILKQKWEDKDTNKEKKFSNFFNWTVEHFEKGQGLFIKNLDHELAIRIPVQLKLEKNTVKYENIDSRDEYKNKNSKLIHDENIHFKFPVISYKQNFKIKRPITDLENFGFKGTNPEKAKSIIYKMWKNGCDLNKLISCLITMKIRQTMQLAMHPQINEKNKKKVKEAKVELQHLKKYKNWNVKIEKYVQKNYHLPNTIISKLVKEKQQLNKTKEEKEIKNWIKSFENEKNIYILTKNNHILETDKYYGFLLKKSKTLKEPNKIEWKTNYKLYEEKRNKIININKNELLVKGTLIEFQNKKETKKTIKVFRFKRNKQIGMHPNSLNFVSEHAKNKKIFVKTNYYESLGNMRDLKDFKFIKTNILGTILKDK